MIGLITICVLIYLPAYFCLKSSGQHMEVTHIKSVRDYFC